MPQDQHGEPQPLTIVLPYLEGDPESYRNQIRLKLFRTFLENPPPPSNGKPDGDEVLKAIIDVMAFQLAHGDAAVSPAAARKFGRDFEKSLRTKMLRWRRDMEDGALPVLSVFRPYAPARN